VVIKRTNKNCLKIPPKKKKAETISKRLIPTDIKRVVLPTEKILESQQQEKEEKIELETPNVQELKPIFKKIRMNEDFDIMEEISEKNPIILEKKNQSPLKKRKKVAFCYYFFDLKNEESGVYQCKVKIKQWSGESTEDGFPLESKKWYKSFEYIS
jgi:hypothetical protein